MSIETDGHVHVLDSGGAVVGACGPPVNRLNVVEARASAATWGPWFPWKDQDSTDWEILGDSDDYGNPMLIASEADDEDADFIAHARADVPWLLEQVKLRDKALEAVMALHKCLTFPDDGIGEPTACGHCDNETWPCPTIRALTAPLEVEG